MAPVLAVGRVRYFYPRSPCGERPCILTILICIALFLSTLSLRRATNSCTQAVPEKSISIHALLAESDIKKAITFYPPVISIHALLAESDAKLYYLSVLFYISIHALLAESDPQYQTRDDTSGISIHALLAESDGFH